jgi:prevent-host-death family protein
MARTELAVQDFRENLADHLERAAFKGERFVVTRNGKPRAALVSIEDLERLEQLDRDSKPAKRRQ